MNFEIVKLSQEDIKTFKKDIQEAFQKGFELVYGKSDGVVLPEKDIDRSLNAKGSVAYKALLDGEFVGGAIVIINNETQINSLDLLYVKYGVQSKGIGYQIWSKIESLHTKTKIWKTCTPYFEKRNLYFYLNKCGFKIVKYFNDVKRSPNDMPEDFIGDGGEGMFEFEKVM